MIKPKRKDQQNIGINKEKEKKETKGNILYSLREERMIVYLIVFSLKKSKKKVGFCRG